jgi:4-amino-4-deoxy-L-arabinose transferase
LAKGFLAFVLLGIVIVPYVIWQGRWVELFTRGWIALLAAIVVIAPWAILVHLDEPDYWHYFFWEEHIKRFASDDAQHGEPIWYYLMFLPLLTLPWIVQLPLAIKGLLQKDGFQGNGFKEVSKFALLWFLMPFIFFSISRGKLPTYVLPCLPPLAVLLATGYGAYFKNSKISGFKFASVVMAALSLIIAVALVLVQTGVIGKIVWYEHESWKWILLALAFVAGALMFMLSIREQSANRRLILQALSLSFLMLMLTVALPQRTADSKMPMKFLLEHADKITADTLVLSDDIMIHAVNWSYKRTDVYMTGSGESKHGLSFEDSRHRLLEGNNIKQFVVDHLNKENMVIVHHSDADAYMNSIMRSIYPGQAQQYRQGMFVLWYIPAGEEGQLVTKDSI